MIDILLQGILEAFPISSSMHLELFNIKNIATMHIGTSVAFFLFNYNNLKEYINKPFSKKSITYGLKILILIIPTIIIGFLIKKQTQFFNPAIINIIFALFMLLSNKQPENNNFENLTILDLFKISFILPFAFIPGVSRLGISFTAFRLFKLNLKESFQYALITGIPITLGAGIIAAIQFVNTQLLFHSFSSGIITYFTLYLTQKSLSYWNYYVIYRILFSIMLLIFFRWA